MNKINVNGIIMRICCNKYKELRKQFKLKEKNILGWEIIDVYGDINLNQEYTFKNNNLILKCEDTYLHLSEKILLALKKLREIYDINEGIVKCDDDLIINKNELIKFLEMKNKEDYIGKNFKKKDIINPISYINFNKVIHNDFLINYYNKHKSDKIYIESLLEKFDKKLKNINCFPGINNIVALGHIYYLSNKSIDIVVDNFIKKNDFTFFSIIFEDNKYYPYVYEDVGIGYILFKNNINFKNNSEMWYNPHYQELDKTPPLNYIGFHTNEGNI